MKDKRTGASRKKFSHPFKDDYSNDPHPYLTKHKEAQKKRLVNLPQRNSSSISISSKPSQPRRKVQSSLQKPNPSMSPSSKHIQPKTLTALPLKEQIRSTKTVSISNNIQVLEAEFTQFKEWWNMKDAELPAQGDICITSDELIINKANVSSEFNTFELKDLKEIIIICPFCKTHKNVSIPRAIFERSGITMITILKQTICEHQFQLFIDRNYSILGSQKADYQVDLDIRKHAGNDTFIFKVSDS